MTTEELLKRRAKEAAWYRRAIRIRWIILAAAAAAGTAVMRLLSPYPDIFWAYMSSLGLYLLYCCWRWRKARRSESLRTAVWDVESTIAGVIVLTMFMTVSFLIARLP